MFSAFRPVLTSRNLSNKYRRAPSRTSPAKVAETCRTGSQAATRRHRGFRVAAGAIAVLLGAAGCEPAPAPPRPPAEAVVETALPVAMRIVEWDEYTGRLDPVEFVEVRARVGGYLQSIHFTEGQVVAKEALLCVIDPRPYAAALNRARADVEEAKAREAEANSRLAQVEAQKKEAEARQDLARKRMQRATILYKANSITKDDFQVQESELQQTDAAVEFAASQIVTARAATASAAAAVESAKAAAAIAALDLEYTEVRAPIAGRVSRRIVTEGNLVSGGSTQASLLTTIVSLDPIHCHFDADESAFLKYMRLAAAGTRQSSRDVKNPVYIGLADEKPGFPHKGHMDFVDNRLDRNTGTMRARAIFRNPDHALTPGLFARLRLPGSGAYDAILVPDSAIGSDQAEKFVYVVGEDHSIERRTVAIGPLVHGLRVVRKGLAATDPIIVQGLQRVRPGIKAAPKRTTISVRNDEGLPDDYAPVPKKDWIPRTPPDAPPPDHLQSLPPTAPVPGGEPEPAGRTAGKPAGKS